MEKQWVCQIVKGRPFSVEIEGCDTVSQVKARIKELAPELDPTMKLVLRCHVLDDNSTVASVKLAPHEVIKIHSDKFIESRCFYHRRKAPVHAKVLRKSEEEKERLQELRAGAMRGDPKMQLQYASLVLSDNRASKQTKQEARRYLQEAADKAGYAPAQFKYSMLLEEEHNPKALGYVFDAQRTYPPAQFTLGMAYLQGNKGVPKNAADAKRYLKLAADNGLAVAQYNYAVIIRKDKGVDMSQVASYFKMAANQGLVRAQFNYAICLYTGNGVEMDKQEACYYFRQAAEQGLVEALYYYGMCCQEEPCDDMAFLGIVPKYEDRQLPGLLSVENVIIPDMDEGTRAFRELAVRENIKGQYMYGVSLQEGRGVTQDMVQGLDWIRRAADKGLLTARLRLGQSIQYGLGCPADVEKGVKMIKATADQGLAAAQVAYGVCLQRGTGLITKYDKAAYKYYNAAAKQHHVEGLIRASACLIQGRGVQVDMSKASDYLKEAADTGNPHAQFGYAQCLEEGKGVLANLSEAKRYFQMAADQGLERAVKKCKEIEEGRDLSYGNLTERATRLQGRASADAVAGAECIEYGKCLIEGRGVRRDLEKAIEWLRMVADNSSSDISMRSEAQYLVGRSSVELGQSSGNSYEMTGKYFQMSAKNGWADGQYMHGVFLYQGIVAAQTQSEGVMFFERAARQNHAQAQYNYGLCLLHGTGVPENPSEAARYFKLAADQGIVVAQYAYAQCLLRGRGVQQDQLLANQYMRMVAEQDFMNEHKDERCYNENQLYLWRDDLSLA